MRVHNYNRFFAAVHMKAKKSAEFFHAQPLATNRLRKYIKDACHSNSIKSLIMNEEITTHSLQGTVATALIESGPLDSAATMRTSDKQIDFLRNYQNLRGREGKEQQSIIFGGEGGDSDLSKKLRKLVAAVNHAEDENRSRNGSFPPSNNFSGVFHNINIIIDSHK